MSLTSHSSYTAVDSDSEKGEHESFLGPGSDVLAGDKTWRWLSLSRILTVAPWLLSIFFAVTSLLLVLERQSSGSPYGTYEDGFDTDIILPSKIPLERVKFTRTPHFTANGSGYLDAVDETAPWPENMKLFGPPSPEIDASWDRLIHDRYFAISEEEATRAWGDRRFEFVDQRRGGYSAGLEVFHTLHCVNALRMMMHPDYYPARHSHGPFHTEHCLDALRQTIQCYGSTTLIPTRYMDGVRHNYIDADQTHVCRSFSFLRDFTTSRAQGNAAAADRDPSLIDPAKHRDWAQWKAEKVAAHRHQHGL
ncbi:hypothetical protein B0T24DRAFT_197577 [Lasiosphaeria ovina]|uniref:Tat pathway signal sequence n=1 Tax=Lasiosphaeria ovina TaxID=92902 RepID=A0AAE0NFN5_9PEZI|nr:hypothetical protein B0T24DRAFT_197577 [Lasiosphaeria ovina]